MEFAFIKPNCENSYSTGVMFREAEGFTGSKEDPKYLGGCFRETLNDVC